MPPWQCASCEADNPEGTSFCGQCGSPTAGRQQHEGEPRASGEGKDEAIARALQSFVSNQVADRIVLAGGRITEERRLVTALFADLSGFTPLADRLDPEQLLEVIDPVITGLTNIVARYEGYVEKYAGDAILAFFGAPIAHEDDGERALLVALDMHRELPRILAGLSPDAAGLTLHVGVNSGHVIGRILGTEVRTDYSVLGDAVIVAQRLESAAAAGDTFVGESTVRLTRDRFVFVPVGDLTLKGKKEPVPAWRLVGGRPAGLAPERDARLVGRSRELAEAGVGLEGLSESRGAVLAITGEPGSGKSRLTRELRADAERRGYGWLEARCPSYSAGLAYRPYSDLVRLQAGIDPGGTTDEALRLLVDWTAAVGFASATPYLARVLGLETGQDDGVDALEPEAFRRGFHQEFAGLLRGMTSSRPVVLVVEDLHWADPSTLALTRELAALCPDAPLLLLATGRDEATPALDELIRSARGVVHEIHLDRLSAESVEALITDTLGAPAVRSLATILQERSAGNPFFVKELCRALIDQDALERDDDAWTLRTGWDAGDVPPTIEGVLAARIDLLPPAAASILQIASVIGRRVRVPLLQAVAVDESHLTDTLHQLVDRGFLDRDGGADDVAFHHALVQDVAYARLLRRQRRDLHRRTAEEVERLYGAEDDTIDLLARHLYLAEAGERAVEYLVRAGERSRRLFANDEASVHLGRAAEIARSDPDAAERLPEILLALADLDELVGRYGEAASLYDEVRRTTGDIRAWRGLAAAHRSRGAYTEALSLLAEALESEALVDDDLRPLWLERGWSLSVSGRMAEAIEALQAGLDAGRRDDVVAAQLLLQLTRAETIENRYESALGHALEARDILALLGESRALATALRILGGDVYSELERLDEATDALERGLALAERVGSAEEIGGCLINLGRVAMKRGNLEEGIALTRRAVAQFERIGHGSGRAIGYVNLAEMLDRVGRYSEAFACGEQALELAVAIGNELSAADAIQIMASVRLHENRYSEAAEHAEAAAKRFVELGVHSTAQECFEIAAEANDAMGKREAARALRARAASLPTNA